MAIVCFIRSMLSNFKKIICAALTAIGLFSNSCSKTKWIWNTEEEYYNLPFWNQRVEEFKKIKRDPNTCTLFIGDSITEGYELNKHFSDNTMVNMGIGGDFTSGILMRLNVVKKLQPKKIFIMIGINDITKGVPRDITHKRYDEILNTLKRDCPNAAIYVQSNLPTTGMGGGAESNQLVLNEVYALNTFLQEECTAKGATFINLYPLFELEGTLNPEYTYDGLHINNDGYKVWTEAIRSMVEQQ